MKPLLLVDGYNIIGAWKKAHEAGWSLDESRDRLLRLMEDYGGYTGEEVVLVFDAHQSDRPMRSEEVFPHARLVFTKKGETADTYIERQAALAPKYRQVRVATSDGLEQSQILSVGAVRLSARELLRELEHIPRQGMAEHKAQQGLQRSPLWNHLTPSQQEELEKLRRGR
ncbi:MAG: NYN domain-containing protein [Clostridia bacterium]|nr:NYN domain-containing protein [Clostridia bacterium]